MNEKKLQGKRIAFLVTDGFEQVELTEPWTRIMEAGALVEIVSPKPDFVQGMHHDKMGDKFPVNKLINQSSASEFDGLVLPGGVLNPDSLRVDQECVNFVKDFFSEGKPVAAICHGPWMLIEADVVSERTVTSWPSLKTDLENAGAIWVDEEVVCDRGLVTSRNPDDLEAFCSKAIEEFMEGIHEDAIVVDTRRARR